MQITLQAVRVYGSKSQYGSVPWSSPRDTPVIVDGYPSPTDSSLVLLGARPDDIFRAIELGYALGEAILRGTSGVARESFIRQKLEQENTSIPANDEYCWYVTIVIQRKIEVAGDKLSDHEYIWVEPAAISEPVIGFRTDATPHLDQLAFFASTVVDPIFFETEVVDNRVVVSAAGRRSFTLPRFSAPNITQYPAIRALDIEKLEQRLQSLASLPNNRRRALDTIKHWHLATLGEHDPWKQFSWSFLALEILTNMLANQLYDQVVNHQIIHASAAVEPNTLPLGELIADKERLTLKQKFAIVALTLSPATAKTDVATFARVKAARDKVAHGELRDVTQLPLDAVRELLAKYLDAAIQFLL